MDSRNVDFMGGDLISTLNRTRDEIFSTEIKPLIYATSATAIPKTLYPSINLVELSKAREFLKEAAYYKKCSNSSGNKCIHPHCQYACYVLDRKGGYVRCGRRDK